MISHRQLQTTAALLRALSHPPRLQIVMYLRGRESTPGDLMAQLAIEPTALAHHLRQLRTAGMLRRERRGSHVFYYVIGSDIGELLDAAFACAPPPIVVTPGASPGESY